MEVTLPQLPLPKPTGTTPCQPLKSEQVRVVWSIPSPHATGMAPPEMSAASQVLPENPEEPVSLGHAKLVMPVKGQHVFDVMSTGESAA